MRVGVERGERGARWVAVRIRPQGCVALAAVVVLLLAALVAAFFGISEFLMPPDVLEPADAIVVLASAPNRTRHAVSLFDEGYAPTVVLTEATYKEVGVACSSALIDAQDARELGLPDGALVVAGRVESTYDEAAQVRVLADERDWHSLIVVTDPFHGRRAGRAFRTLMPDVTVRITAAPGAKYDPARWWTTEKGIMAVVSELIKLAFYWVRYGVTPF